MKAGSNVHTSSSASLSSGPILRPRARRLISGLSDEDSETSDSFLARTTSTAPRTASPIPPAHLSRSALSRREGGTAPAGSFWDSSWSTLQGLASDLIGTDVSTSDTADAGTKRTIRPLSRLYGSRISTTNTPDEWGPASKRADLLASDIGAGTRQEHLSNLRAEKRRALLTQQESSYADALGKFKRRLSDDLTSASVPPTEADDRDSLVYVHHVQKHDTLAGISIKYHCNGATLRKANRMWPNDTAQSRETILIPVDACAVKGRPVTNPADSDLLGSEDSVDLLAGQAEEILPSSNPTPKAGESRQRALSSSTRNSSLANNELAWQPDSWVVLSGSTQPTQIGRIPRRAVGYFPPARRKSQSFSDVTSSTPSLDLDRSCVNNDDPPPSPGPHRKGSRQSSRVRSMSAARLPPYLAGPGGVGPLGKHVHVPGPAEDGLNKYFAKHLPDVAPPRYHQTLLAPNLPFYTDRVTPSSSGTTTPSRNPKRSNVGGQIETWARKLASLTQEAMQPGPKQKLARSSDGASGRGIAGIGDLIEMTNDFDIGGGNTLDHDQEQSRPLDARGGDRVETQSSNREQDAVRGRTSL